MIKTNIFKFADSYKDEYWNKFYRCFPVIISNKNTFSNIPSDILSSLIGLIGEEQVENWMNSEFEELDNMKPIDLLKTDNGVKALKMYILSMPN